MSKILFVSDYITNIWGIENYIHNTAKLFTDNGDEVSFLWLDTKLTKNKRFRQLLLPVTALNIYIWLRLLYIYITQKPDIIYFHSITRFVWRFPVWISGFLPVQKLMMYHDLWFVSPYPSDIYDITKLPKSRNWSEFLESNYSDNLYIDQKWSASKIKYIYTKGIIWLKFFSISLWRFFAIRNIDKHLIPSSFMIDILQNRWIKKQSIFVLWHFGSRAK